MANAVSFSSVNQQLDFTANAPVTINDTLVRALTGNGSIQPTKSPISFADLSGKVGVANVVGPTSNSQASYFNPTVSTLVFSFNTDVYNPQILWSTTLPPPAVLTPNGKTATLSLTKTGAGNVASNGSVTAQLSYANTLIGSSTLSGISLYSEVYPLNASWVNSPSANVTSLGFSAQTATATVSLSSNVTGGSISYTVSPMDAGVTIGANSVVLTSSSPTVAGANNRSYTVTATISISNSAVGASSEVVNLLSQRYANTFTLTSPGDKVFYANTGTLTAQSTFTVSNVPVGGSIVWSSNAVNGSLATLSSTSGTATLTLPISNTTVPFNAQTSVTSVTATMLDAYNGNGVISSCTATVALSGLTSGLVETWGANGVASGFTAQTVSSLSTANVSAGSVTFTAVALTGNGTPTITSGSNASVSLTASQSTPGSNTSTWKVTPVVSAFGSPFFTDTGRTISLSATLFTSANVTIVGPSSNVQVANAGPVPSSIILTANASNGTSVVWTATPSANSSNAVVVSNTSQCSLTLTTVANTYQYLYSTYTVTANCYDPNTGSPLSSNSKVVTLESGAYGLTMTLPAASTQTGFVAQTAGGPIVSSVQAGGLVVESNNALGFLASSTPALSPTSNIAVVQSAVGTNTQSYSISAGIYDTNNVKVADIPAGTRTYTSTVNLAKAVTISGPSSNTQIGQTAATSTIVLTANISNGTMVNWTAVAANGSATADFTTNAASCTLTLSTSTYQYLYSTYTVTANCYDPGTGTSLSSNTKTVNLEVGAHGLSYSALPAVLASGYTAQTAIVPISASVQAGYVVLQSSNPSGITLPTGLGSSASGSASVPMTSVGTNTQSYTITAQLYDTNSVLVGSSGLGTASGTAQVNSYSFSSTTVPSTQITTSTTGSVVGSVSATTSIPGGYFGSWTILTPVTGVSIGSSSNTSASLYGDYSSIFSSNSGFSANPTVGFTLFDSQGRTVTTGSNTVALAAYYLNPVVSIANATSSTFAACTVTGSYSFNMSPAGGVSLSVSTSTTGSATIGTSSSNNNYFAAPVSVSSTGGTANGTASFSPTISYSSAFGSSSYAWSTGTVSVSISVANAGVTFSTGTSTSSSGFSTPQVSHAIVTASCNASLPSPSWVWGTFTTTSGSFTGFYGSSNTGSTVTYDMALHNNSIGTVSATGYMASASLYSNGVLVGSFGPSPSATATSTVYNSAVGISGSTSSTTSNLFESVASLTQTATANASIPSLSYNIYATKVSGSTASVGYGSNYCNISLDAVHQTLSATYSVSVTAYSGGTAVGSASRNVTLSASGTVPSYSISTPGTTTSAGFNWPQTATATVSITGLSGGAYAVYNGTGFQSYTWSTPGGSNSYISMTVSQSAVGTNQGTAYMNATVYDPSGRSLWTGSTSGFVLGATVYNAAMNVSQSNAVTNVGTTLNTQTYVSSNCNVFVTSNTIPGGYYTFTYGPASGYPITTSNITFTRPNGLKNSNTGMQGSAQMTVNSGISGDVTSGTMAWTYSAAIMLNGQQIAGPWGGTVSANVYGIHGLTCPLYSDWVIKKSWFGWKHFIHADQVKVGDRLLLSDDTWGMVVYSQPAMSEAVKVTAMGAGSLSCSVSAPLQTEGPDVLAKDALNARVLVKDMGFMTVTGVDELGQQLVQHITMEGPKRHFWTGDEKICLFAHHNAKPNG